jgi:predicted GH43/DUF377 family glycosyl hydrolase
MCIILPLLLEIKVFILYRADDTPRPEGWGRTCRIGLAYSNDGYNFTRLPEPVFYPDNDFMKEYEWEGGTEDLHIIEDENGTYYMNYTAWNGTSDALCIATSTDLIHWKKHGTAFKDAYSGRYVKGSRSGVVVSRLKDERLIATKIKGKYWMYYTHNCLVATSDDLIHWTPMLNDDGRIISALNDDRTGHFDKGSAEAGAIALLTDRGILVMYNGFNLRLEGGGDPEFPYGWVGLGQALIDAKNPIKVLKRADKPFIYAEYDWELQGFTPVTIVANGMVYFKGQWLLYYGATDRWIGLGIYDYSAF